MSRVRRRILCVSRVGPHGGVRAHEALEVVLIAAAFDQRVSVLLLDDGVYQLLAGQRTEALGTKNFAPAFRALEMYDVERVVVGAESLAARGLDAADLLMPVEVRDREGVARLIDASEVVLTF